MTAFEWSIRVLLKLHKFTCQGVDETDIYDDVLASFENKQWSLLTDGEKELLGELSTTLYELSDRILVENHQEEKA